MDFIADTRRQKRKQIDNRSSFEGLVRRLGKRTWCSANTFFRRRIMVFLQDGKILMGHAERHSRMPASCLPLSEMDMDIRRMERVNFESRDWRSKSNGLTQGWSRSGPLVVLRESVVLRPARLSPNVMEQPMEWIAVGDRNPDRYGEYLGSTKARPRGWVFKFAPVGWICSDDYPVTHWMPLPDPPHNPAMQATAASKEVGPTESEKAAAPDRQRYTARPGGDL